MRTYDTIAGDAWDMISYRAYGDEGYVGELIQANPALAHITIFSKNVRIVIPDASPAKVANNLPPWRR